MSTDDTVIGRVIEIARPLEGYCFGGAMKFDGEVMPATFPLRVPADHPLAGREAYQCLTCEGIFFPEAVPPTACPYCQEDDEHGKESA